jgi:hypothetical protein
MVGIYNDSFIQYLKDNLGDPIKITGKNIIIRCPWCELNKQKDHYHLYISTEAPIFRCWHAGCTQSGFITKLTKAIDGKDKADLFVDKDKIKENTKRKVKLEKSLFKVSKLIIPTLDPKEFPAKELYIKKRLKFSNTDLTSINGLIFDVKRFVEENKIIENEKFNKMKDYMHTNFVCFLSEHNSIAMFRNIDPSSSFKHFKLQLKKNHYADYFKLNGMNPKSNHVVMAEGIYDIFSEHIFDKLNLKEDVRLYAASFSGAYTSIIKSLSFYEQIFRMDVTILSDRDVSLDVYKKLKRFNSHIINKLTVFYNKTGKDFNDLPLVPEKIVL